jgi:hypothetical protein
MNSDDRPVNIRTSSSACNFWSRQYESDEIDPNGRVKPRKFGSILDGIPKTSPYQLQQMPFNVCCSRSRLVDRHEIERMVFRKEISDLERMENRENHEVNIMPQRAYELLRKKNDSLEKQNKALSRINYALAKEIKHLVEGPQDS